MVTENIKEIRFPLGKHYQVTPEKHPIHAMFLSLGKGGINTDRDFFLNNASFCTHTLKQSLCIGEGLTTKGAKNAKREGVGKKSSKLLHYQLFFYP